MPTDSERREVARRLRKAIGLTEFAEVLGFDWTDDSDWYWKDVSNLVADLIEPESERTCHDETESPMSFLCGECGWFWNDPEDDLGFRYCPNCGARVVEE